MGQAVCVSGGRDKTGPEPAIALPKRYRNKRDSCFVRSGGDLAQLATRSWTEDRNNGFSCFEDELIRDHILTLLSTRQLYGGMGATCRRFYRLSHQMPLFQVRDLTPEKGEQLTRALPLMAAQLQTLILISSPLSTEAMKNLEGAIVVCGGRLKKLVVKNCSINAEGFKLMTAKMSSSSYTPILMHLDLKKNHLESSGAGRLAEVMRHTNELQTLCLTGNRIGDKGATSIAKSLKFVKSLRRLELYGNELTDSGATVIADSLTTGWCSIDHLDLGGNHIGDEGGLAIAKALRNNISPKHLSLYFNNIGDHVGRELGLSLANESGLVRLDVGLNPLGEEGVSGIANGLKRNGYLMHLNLQQTEATERSLEQLLQAMKINQTLQSLNVWGNTDIDERAETFFSLHQEMLGREGRREAEFVIPIEFYPFEHEKKGRRGKKAGARRRSGLLHRSMSNRSNTLTTVSGN